MVEVVEKDDLVVEIEDDSDHVTDDSDFMNMIWMTIGVIMLSIALFMSATMGICQVSSSPFLSRPLFLSSPLGVNVQEVW